MKSFLFIETMHASSEIIISAAIYQRFKPIISSYSGNRFVLEAKVHCTSDRLLSLSLSLEESIFTVPFVNRNFNICSFDPTRNILLSLCHQTGNRPVDSSPRTSKFMQ